MVNRCLGSIPDNIILSEVSPYSSVIPMEEQAKNWFSLISAEECQSLSGQNFVSKLKFIMEKANVLNKKLVIRDWTTADFLANGLGDGMLSPSGLLEQELYLSHHGLKTCPVVISRRAADVYESLTRTFEQYHSLSIDEFSLAYLEYAKAVCQYPIFHYEELCKDPHLVIKQICNILDINYDFCFADHFWKFTSCTGDNTLSQPSRGSKENKIVALPSNTNSNFYISAIQNENCCQADRLLNYVNNASLNTNANKFWKIIENRDYTLGRLYKNHYQNQAQLAQSQSELQQTQAQLTQSQSELQQTQAQLAEEKENNQRWQNNQVQQLQNQIEETDSKIKDSYAEIDAMKTSKFWKIREIWLALRK
ncbi:MAG: hypothetical protein AB4058_15835 [Microcystaceae cyanobacterium]